MPKFTVDHTSQQDPDSAFDTIKNLLSGDGELKKFDTKAQVDFNESGKVASIKGAQFKADMKVSGQGNGSTVAVTVDIPFMLTPFKGKIQESIQKMLKKHLA